MNKEIKEMLEQMKIIQETGKDKNGIKVDGFGLQQYDLKILLDYITNLQQENERLAEAYYNKQDEYNKLFNHLINDKPRERIKKAIEYINKCVSMQLESDYLLNRTILAQNINNLLNILQNGSDEE